MNPKTIKLVLPLLFAGAAAWAQPASDRQNPPAPPQQGDNGAPPQQGRGGFGPNGPGRGGAPPAPRAARPPMERAMPQGGGGKNPEVGQKLHVTTHAPPQASTPPTNDAILHQMQELQAEVKALQAEVTALKGAPATASAPAPAEATTPTAPAAPAAAVATTSAPGASPAPTGLAGLLGPTTLSGFVDTYYGYNSNQPAGRQNGLRNFDINSGQFALNMLELIADKAVDNSNRVGYQIG